MEQIIVDSVCYTISEECRQSFKSLVCDINNPHVLGIDATEALFLEDNVILVEGQEDVVIYNQLSSNLEIELFGSFYGWGVGGASKMQFFLMLFKNLGYKHVVAIFDGDKEQEAHEVEEKYPEYKIIILKENDIRDKKERHIAAKIGITDEKGHLKDKYKDYIIQLFVDINSYFEH